MARLSDEIKKQIPILYKELGTYKAVAEKLNISPATASKYVKEAQLQSAAPSVGKVNITDEIKEQINNYFSFSLNYAETAREFGISVSVVKNCLTKENLDAAAAQSKDKHLLVQYIEELFGEISSWNCVQMSKFKKNGINYKAQYLTLKYWFEVKQSDKLKANGSIGIIPHVVDQAREYYLSKMHRRKLNEEKLIQQKSNEHIEVSYTPGEYFIAPNRKKKLIDLDSLSDVND